MAIQRVRLKGKSQLAPAKPQSAVVKSELSQVKSALSPVKPPQELAQFFGDPPLAGNEKREEYENLFASIAAAAKPADAIAWLFVRDIADLSWETRREKILKLQAIKIAQETAVARLLSPRPKEHHAETATPEAQDSAREWASDAKARLKINRQLAEWGYDQTYILAKAFEIGSRNIDAIDQRIAYYEVRWMTALRMIEQYSEKLAHRLETASSKIIDGDYTEVNE